MPNWKLDSDYKFCYELSSEGWAWEFLRRNSEYRQDYLTAMTMEQEDNEKFGERAFVFHNDEIRHRFYYEPEKQENESDKAWVNRCLENKVSPRRLSPGAWFGRKWGLGIPIQSPDIDEAPRFAMIRPGHLLSWDELDLYYDGDESNNQQKINTAVIGFDLEKPLPHQLKFADEQLKKKTKQAGYSLKEEKGPSIINAKWPSYLRVFDARNCGAEPKEIISILFSQKDNGMEGPKSETQAVYDHFQAAKKLINKGGYMTCLM